MAGARRFRAAQRAELFSLPARIVDIDDAETVLWQLVENSQRVDVHPYEEAQGFQRLLDMPGYDVATLVEKSGKSPAHVYARLSLLQLIPAIAVAFSAERITADRTQWSGASILQGSYSTRRCSRNAITRRAPAISISAGCHDAPPNGVEIPVRRFAISVNFIGVSFGTGEMCRPADWSRTSSGSFENEVDEREPDAEVRKEDRD